MSGMRAASVTSNKQMSPLLPEPHLLAYQDVFAVDLAISQTGLFLVSNGLSIVNAHTKFWCLSDFDFAMSLVRAQTDGEIVCREG